MSGRLSGITTAYGKAGVLNGVSLTVEPGRITRPLGSNGSGKTTLIRSIRPHPPRAGNVRFDGADITGLPPTGSSPPASPAFLKAARCFR